MKKVLIALLSLISLGAFSQTPYAPVYVNGQTMSSGTNSLYSGSIVAPSRVIRMILILAHRQ
jgi:hypothetical protein